MPIYFSHTFTKTDDTGFQTEFSAYITKRNEYWYSLGLVNGTHDANLDDLVRDTGLFVITVVATTSLFETVFLDGWAVNVVEKYRFLSVATDAEIAASNAVNEGLTAAQLIEKYRYLTVLPPSVLKEKTTDSERTTEDKRRASQAHLDFVLARIALKIAIKNEFGEGNYQILKWPTELEKKREEEDADTLTLGLLSPSILTDTAINVTATTVTLRSKINPNHIDTTTQFKYFIFQEGGDPTEHFAPVDPSNLGNGTVNVDFSTNLTGLSANITYKFLAIANSKYLGQFLGNDLTFTTTQASAHVVTFDGNGNDGGSMEAQSSNVAVALFTNGFTLTGYTFNGWNTATDGSGTAYIENAIYSFAEDITLYAQWVQNLAGWIVYADGGAYQYLDEFGNPHDGSDVGGAVIYTTFSENPPIAILGCNVQEI